MSETNTATAPVDAEEVAKKAAAKVAKAEAKAKAKADAKVAKEAAKQPKQNDVRRPKPNTTTGKVWAVFDELSSKTGSPATIGDSLKQLANSVPEATVRTQYARWRKFHGIVGRTAPVAAETAAT